MARPGVAFCGSGTIASVHAACAAELGLPVLAVASRTPEHAERLAQAYGAPVVSYADLPGEATMVVVATPPQCHAADVLRMLDAGATVMVEKPLCRTLAEADALVAAAEQHPGRLLYAENLAYSPVVQRLVQMTPQVGALSHVEVRCLQGLPTWGDFTSDEWGGGALFDLGVHPVAVALLVANSAGLGRPAAVSARLTGGPGHGSDEHAEVWLHHRGGLVTHVVASWQAADVVWDVQVAGDRGVLRAELLPTLGLEVDGEPVHVGRRAAKVAGFADFGYVDQLDELAAMAARRANDSRPMQPLMTAAFGREVLQVVTAAYVSAGMGAAEVPLPLTGRRDLTPLQWWRGVNPS